MIKQGLPSRVHVFVVRHTKQHITKGYNILLPYIASCTSTNVRTQIQLNTCLMVRQNCIQSNMYTADDPTTDRCTNSA